MRQLAYLGVAALTAVALLGIGCSSSDNNGGTTETGGAGNVGGATSNSGGTTSTGTKSTGGSTSTSTAHTGGVTNAGGVTGAGGNASSGGAAAGGGSSVIPLTGGLELTGDAGNYLKIDGFEGVVWTTSDAKNGTRTDIPYSDITITPGEMCVTGTAQVVPYKAGSTKEYDYTAVWGAEVGWNINQPSDADGGASDPAAADVSDYASVTLDFEGTGTILPMRVQMEVPDPNGGASTTYCAPIGLGSLPVTIPLTSLKTNCWSGGTPQNPFDPLTMKPSNLQIQVWTNTTKANPFNFCVTDIKFNSDADGG